MGSPDGEACRLSYETQHTVILTHAFEISTTEITQEQFNSVRGYQPTSFFPCANCAQDTIDWHDAAAYCNALSTNRGYATCYDCGGSGANVTCAQNPSYTSGNIYHCPGYRLPTEAEWEYAYRAGTTTSLHNGTNLSNCSSGDTNADLVSWNKFNDNVEPKAVGGRLVNNWGLYDMAGNIGEWVNDRWNGSTDYGTSSATDPWGHSTASDRVFRGGSWLTNNTTLRASCRLSYPPTTNSYVVGARCSRTN